MNARKAAAKAKQDQLKESKKDAQVLFVENLYDRSEILAEASVKTHSNGVRAKKGQKHNSLCWVNYGVYGQRNAQLSVFESESVQKYATFPMSPEHPYIEI